MTARKHSCVGAVIDWLAQPCVDCHGSVNWFLHEGWTGKQNESQPFVKKKSPFIESMCSVRICCDKYTRLSWYSPANTGLETAILPRNANHSKLDSIVAYRNLFALKSRMPANPQRKISKERLGRNETALRLSETIGVTDITSRRTKWHQNAHAQASLKT